MLKCQPEMTVAAAGDVEHPSAFGIPERNRRTHDDGVGRSRRSVAGADMSNPLINCIQRSVRHIWNHDQSRRHPLLKMNGLGNEIVIIDLRVARGAGRRGSRDRNEADRTRPADGPARRGQRIRMHSSASTTETALSRRHAATAPGASAGQWHSRLDGTGSGSRLVLASSMSR